MSTTISQLPKVFTTLDPTSLLEVSVPDEEAPTGYRSMSVEASQLGGNVPFRHKLFYEEVVNDGVGIIGFSVFIPNTEWSQEAFIPYPNDEFPWTLSAALGTIKMLGYVQKNYQNDVPDKSSVIVSGEYYANFTSYNDASRILVGDFTTDNGSIYNPPNTYPNATNTYADTWTGNITSIVMENSDIRISVELQRPQSASPTDEVTALRVYGYIDLNLMFGPTDTPPQ
jgi:hypothetical protein